ncbi:MAG: PIN domain-containing protein [Polaromonas sp.]|nr:PIN domain-containing protein [Polaromonas sp.]
MNEVHALLDFENVQPSLEELEVLAPGLTKIWLFHGPHQNKRAEKVEAADSRVTLVPRSAPGPNSLDFHLTFHLGYAAAKHPEARLMVVSNDKDYDPMILHAQTLGFTVSRVGHGPAPKVGKTAARPVVKKAAKAKASPAPSAPPAPKKAAKAPAAVVAKISVTPAKVNPPKKSAVAKTPPAAKKAAAKKTPAKKVAAKKAVLKNNVAKKVVLSKQAASRTSGQVKPPPLAEDKGFLRIKKGLVKMGNKAPHKHKSFLKHVGAQLGKDSTTEQVEAMVRRLEKAGLVRIAGDLVLY